jgi:predicted phosphodiesterase
MIISVNKILMFTIVLFIFTGCEDMFDFSPYESSIQDEYKNTTLNNLERIKKLETKDSTIKFAVISDSHNDYDDLKAAIKSINNNPEILFVLHTGDFTDLGLLKEYEIFHDIMSGLSVPYLTVIGNHDYRSNGGKIYEDMFGDYNYTFSYNNNKFILFDNVLWESNNKPDSVWLQKELSNPILYDHIFVLSHMPPFSDQFDDQQEDRYKNLMSSNEITLSLHGHYHTFSSEEKYQDGVKYIVVPRSKEKSYIIISAHQNSVNVEKVVY